MIMWFWGGLWGGALGVAEFAVAGIAVEKGSGKQGTKKGKKTTTSRKQLGRQKREREREREKRETEAAGAIASSGDLFDS